MSREHDEERRWKEIEEQAEHAWSKWSGSELSVWDEISMRMDAGREPNAAAEEIAREIGDLAYADITVADLEGVLSQWARNEARKHEGGSDNMPTGDVNVQLNPGRESGGADEAETVRFQTEAAAKERALAEGIVGDKRLRLFEIHERMAVRGETVRWEIRDLETGAVTHEGGPMFLDDPNFNDAALAEARGVAYAAIRDLTNSNYRDLRGSNKMSDAIQASHRKCDGCGNPIEGDIHWKEKPGEGNLFGREPKAKPGTGLCPECAKKEDSSKEASLERKKALLLEQVRGMRLTAGQRKIMAGIEEQIGDLSEEFLSTVGSLMKQPWDAGSSWEVVEAGGETKLVRKETQLDESSIQTKHAFREGQTLRIDAGLVPEDVIVREALGERRYKVQSQMSGRVFDVDESDLYDPSRDDSMFQAGTGLTLGDVAHLF